MQDLKQRLKESINVKMEERTAWEIDKTNQLQKITNLLETCDGESNCCRVV